jgi:hypothetical protein
MLHRINFFHGTNCIKKQNDIRLTRENHLQQGPRCTVCFSCDLAPQVQALPVLNTFGFGNTPGQEKLILNTAQARILSDTDMKEIVSNKLKGGRSPESWLCDKL